MKNMENKMLEALRARMKTIRKPLTPEQARERLLNSEFFKRLKQAKGNSILNTKEE